MHQLNPQQQAAVTAQDGPTLVLAGAGSGKTRVIVERMAWLVEERGVDPRHLLALTFTNKAAGEMRERFAARIGVERVAAWLGTFHSFGLFLLRREGEALGINRAFTVFDDTDQKSLVKKLVQDLPDKLKYITPREALTRISEFKQRVAEPEPDEDEALRTVWTKYHEALRRASAVDFDDLLVLPVRLFEQNKAAAEKYQRRYRYALIDEYQDTNHAQYRLARALTDGHGNLFAVGDEDQAIYSWRGADIRNILDFARDFPEAQVYKLEVNYRSTQAILDCANRVVANNIGRLGKTLRAAQHSGERVRLFEALDGEEEARFIVEDLVRSGVAVNEVAVLYRTNAQARLIEESLRLRGLNYIVIGGTKFYARKEIKDILAYLRLLVVPNDDVSFRRVINVPARGIGAATLQLMEDYALQRDCSLMQVARESDQDQSFSARARNSLYEFVHTIDELALGAGERPLQETVETLLDRVGYRAYVEQSDEKDFRDRLDLVDEFVVGVGQWQTQGGQGGVLEYLQDLALLTDADTLVPGAPAVTLMTCHSAKGLEFPHVYLCGMEEGLFPLTHDSDDEAPENLEEERRLCYVAMTRARERLTLSCAAARTVYGRRHEMRQPSRFIFEAGMDRLELLRKAPKAAARPVLAPRGPAGEAPHTLVASAPMAPANPHEIRVGTQVRHAKFGLGTVMQANGTGPKMRVRIRFKTGKNADFVVGHTPIEIVKG